MGKQKMTDKKPEDKNQKVWDFMRNNLIIGNQQLGVEKIGDDGYAVFILPGAFKDLDKKEDELNKKEIHAMAIADCIFIIGSWIGKSVSISKQAETAQGLVELLKLGVLNGMTDRHKESGSYTEDEKTKFALKTLLEALETIKKYKDSK